MFKVRNNIVVPAFPAAIIINVYFKHLFETEEILENISYEIKDFGSYKETIYEANLSKLKNYRSPLMKPGIDAAVELRFPVYSRGNYEYIVIAEDEKLCISP
ncbi:hypothetical protein [Bacillus cereus]|uniref:hypothetical protein n=1 Tax=Bacillus cereus TaxID=1396 RepID=UPI000BF71915|nr:hypothetical protein [Bacillus cereus]PEW08809.1 hypothetical protein CN440_20700 [Bacillus cereus]